MADRLCLTDEVVGIRSTTDKKRFCASLSCEDHLGNHSIPLFRLPFESVCDAGLLAGRARSNSEQDANDARDDDSCIRNVAPISTLTPKVGKYDEREKPSGYS
jgi:hypothetical protein